MAAFDFPNSPSNVKPIQRMVLIGFIMEVYGRKMQQQVLKDKKEN
tara:strand:- start:318 stop:452 length:135 start_codon:yes stop_codon:yes gene_type:complete